MPINIRDFHVRSATAASGCSRWFSGTDDYEELKPRHDFKAVDVEIHGMVYETVDIAEVLRRGFLPFLLLGDDYIAWITER